MGKRKKRLIIKKKILEIMSLIASLVGVVITAAIDAIIENGGNIGK
ncbi:MAG: hypothetical protein UH543_04975 [Bacteroidales bacterium]|nr:hypothetical protein [Bacteroidales bacterium]